MDEKKREQYGMLRVELYTRADRNYYSDMFYLYADMLHGDGFIVNNLLPSHYNEYVSTIHASATNEQCNEVKIESSYGNATLSIDADITFKTGTIGLSYASCEITITLLSDDEEERKHRKMIIDKADELVDNGWELLSEGFSDGADECVCKAIGLLSPIADSSPIALRIVLSDAYYLSGYIYSRNGDEKEKTKALSQYEQAEMLREKLVRETKDKVVLRKYAQIESALGLLYKDMKDYRTTETYMQKAAEMYRHVDEIAPGEYRGDYATTLAELANAQRMNENNSLALKTCREGINVCQMPHDESEEEDYLIDAIICQEIISLIYSEEEDYAEAIAQGEKLMEMLHLLCHKNNTYASIIKAKEEWLSEQHMLLAEVDFNDDNQPDDDGRFDAWA